MKKFGMLGIIGGAALLTVAPFSLQWSQDDVSLSLNSANARIGRSYYGPAKLLRAIRRQLSPAILCEPPIPRQLLPATLCERKLLQLCMWTRPPRSQSSRYE